MPATAARTIQDVLEEFLAEQDARLSPATFRRYASSVELLWMHLNGYGHSELSHDELERFERAFEEGDEEAFCHLFGPDKIIEQIPHFLYLFMLRKVMARESDLLAAATTSRKLVRWLVERGYGGESPMGWELHVRRLDPFLPAPGRRQLGEQPGARRVERMSSTPQKTWSFTARVPRSGQGRRAASSTASPTPRTPNGDPATQVTRHAGASSQHRSYRWARLVAAGHGVATGVFGPRVRPGRP
jgi:hypothetical protein